MNLIQSAGFLPFQLAKGLENRAKTLVFGEEPTVARVNTVNNRDKILSFSVKTFDELRARVEEELACDGVRLFHCNGEMRAEIFDFNYVQQLERKNEIITALAPGQSFKRAKKSTKKVVPVEKPRMKRHVPPPEGEIARMTIDIFKQNEDDIGSIKITTSLSENSAMSYDIHIPAVRQMVQLGISMLSKFLVTFGAIMMGVGNYLNSLKK